MFARALEVVDGLVTPEGVAGTMTRDRVLHVEDG